MAPTPEYQSLCFTNHTKSCPTYWHHIFIFTQVLSSIISSWRHHRGHFTIYTVNSHLHSEFSLSQTHPFALKSPAQLNQPRGRPHQFTWRKPLTRRANQRASSGHVIISCHPIGPRATMTTRLFMTFIQVKQYMIYNPLGHNDIKPIFATLPHSTNVL